MTSQFLRDHQIPATIVDLVKSAKDNLFLVSPWLELKDQTYLSDALEECIKKGVKITVICRQPRKDTKHADALKRLESGIAELVYDSKLHAKLIVVDNESLLVTSANLIETSQTKNHETGIVTRDEFLVKQAIDYLEEIMNAPGVRRYPKNQFCRGCRKIIEINPDKPWCLDCWNELPLSTQKPYLDRLREKKNRY